jgi:hypothetical protein
MARQAIANSALSQLVVVDIQTKLSTAMVAEEMQKVVKQCGILLQAAHALEIPIVVSEQYPQGLGESLPEISQYFESVHPVAKTAFSACREPRISAQLHQDRSQIILTGMETHICVLQTAIDLLDLGKQVFVVEDAVISRDANNKVNALKRLQAAGCIICSSESVAFEWLGSSQHEAFKTIAKLIR